MKILVVGGAGYIGSHMLKRLQNTKHEVEVLDNLSTGFETNTLGFPFHKCDLADKDHVYTILQKKYDLVMHFASYINVGESYINPQKYYENNVQNTLNLLSCMIDLKILNFIFSSTAAVYGEPESVPISEDQKINPVNPYGQTKAIVENILKDYDKAYGLKFMSLRYFNACGAHPDGTIGERHDPETHLIPLILQAASGRKDKVKVYGDDYPTKDGTCIRDYIHVMDLAEAHLLALEDLYQNQSSEIYNIGNNQGFSVSEIVNAAKEITQKKINIEISDRRKGDPGQLIADNNKIIKNLKWSAQYSDLKTIISSAWQWEQKLLRSNS
ncbi:UDP-glucose 4-epimerase GalE [Alphaproteobacteria bacterium]|nr:UDP-glucose 4-epimerase GalE [Alphaproteobacteria bacterium]